MSRNDFPVLLQMAFFCLLLTVYFLQPLFVSVETLASSQRWLRWIPSVWFFALFQELSGSMPEQLTFLVRRAWTGLAIAGSGAVAAYLICYYRTLRKIVEQPDITPGARGVNWFPVSGIRSTPPLDNSASARCSAAGSIASF